MASRLRNGCSRKIQRKLIAVAHDLDHVEVTYLIDVVEGFAERRHRYIGPVSHPVGELPDYLRGNEWLITLDVDHDRIVGPAV